MPQDDLSLIRACALPVVEGTPTDNVLFDLVGDAHLVLIGEASHGTHEFYEARARMTRRLIQEKGFRAVAVEGDWPDAYRVNQFVRGHSKDETAEQALRGFQRFPAWMWRNEVVLDFVALAARAQRRRGLRRAGRLLRARPLQPEPLRRGGHRLPGAGSTRPRPSAPASATPAWTTTPPTRARSSAAARRSAPASSASASWSSSWSS